ncbi:transglycosylase SLT domain-containing protein [Thalassococcus sp. BH17M4-6]|uniref:transglycosylase SLT domain-containing protein n=1 Tax=Thalassococcus sp. BH17M4-6 TaxID=3413148 RepID=UPI003BD90C9F
MRLSTLFLVAGLLPQIATAETEAGDRVIAVAKAVEPENVPGAQDESVSPLAVATSLRPHARSDLPLPRTRWAHRPRGAIWSRAAVSALRGHAGTLPRTVPRDIDAWCPAYRQADIPEREAFWVGLLSALAKHESTYRASAVGGGGRWYGLLQILPGTARGYGCKARTGAALKHGPSNLSCALRIMARTVARDGVVSEGMRGVAADWGPFHSRSKRRDMMAWLREQSYCKPISKTRPRARPS